MKLSLRFTVLLSFPLICGLVAFFYHTQLFNLLLSSRDQLATFVAKHYYVSLLLYTTIFIIDNILALPLASLMTFAAGYFYGPFVATTATLAAATCGATFSFLVSRHLVGTHLQRLYQDRLTNFNHWFNQWGSYYLFIVRLVPVVPFALVNIFAGLTKAQLKTFVLTTFFGMIPVTTLFAFSGREFKYISSFSDILNGRMLFFLIIFCILTLLPFLLKKLRLVV